MLCFYHIALGLMDKWIFEEPRVRYSQALIVFIIVVMITYLCQDWLYFGDNFDFDKAAIDQRIFQTWLWIEVLMFYGMIINGMIYTLCSTIKPCVIKIYDGNQEEEGRGDFMESNAMMVKIFV